MGSGADMHTHSNSPLASWLLVALVLLAYPVAGFYPYRVELPGLAVNTAEARPDGGFRFPGPGPGLARTASAPDWLASAKRTGGLTVDLSVRPLSLDQSGPARILTLSRNTLGRRDPSARNFTVGQSGRDLILRLRSTWNGADAVREMRIPTVFISTEWIDIVVNIGPAKLTTVIDGQTRFAQGLDAAPLKEWNTTLKLGLGNELTGDRPWRGEIKRAVIKTGATSMDYAKPGAVERPPLLWYVERHPVLIPFRAFDLGDATLNLLGFVPLGILLGYWSRQRGRRTLWAPVTQVMLISLGIEFLQLGVVGRVSSVDDLVLNTLGGSMGIALAGLLPRSHFARRGDS
jgi:hypothetical protein